jgi:hypothetical protein
MFAMSLPIASQLLAGSAGGQCAAGALSEQNLIGLQRRMFFTVKRMLQRGVQWAFCAIVCFGSNGFDRSDTFASLSE